jgi:AcrR family transcriptional regulator
MSLREEKEQLTRQAIYDAAFGLFCHQGIEATEMMQIAKKAHCSRPTLYRYFESKHVLAESLYLENLARLIEPYHEWAPAADTCLDFICAFLDHVLTKLKTSPMELVYDAVYNLYASRIHIDPTRMPAHPWNTGFHHQLLQYLETNLQDGSIQPVADAAILRDTIVLPYFAYIQRLAIFSFQKGESRRQESLREAELLRDFYLNVITPA